MEARLAHTALFVAAVCSLGASYRTTNFIVNAPNETLAREIGDAAERYRADLAMEWLGRELPRWSQPCPITAHVGAHMGAGRCDQFYVRPQSAVRLENDNSRIARAGTGQRFAA